MTTIETKCILRHSCAYAGVADKCNGRCTHLVAMHGASGEGGRVASANVPRDYALLTLANTPIKEAQGDVFKKITAYIKTFTRQFENSDDDRIKSLYLFSESPGTGKTTTAATILNEYLIRHYVGSLKRNKQPLQQPAYFLDVNELQTLFNQFNRPRVPNEIAEPAAARYYTMLKTSKQAPFVVMDDIGVRENCTEAFRGDLHDLINHRVTSRLPSVYTSNIPIDELATIYDARLYDRIRDLCGVVPFEGESKRGFRR